MAGTRHQQLGVDRATAERRAGLGGAGLEGRRQRVGVGHHPHAAAAAAGHRLEHQRAGRVVAALVGEEVLQLHQRGGLGARQQRQPALGGQRAGAGLVAKQRKLGRRRADEDQPGVGAGLGEVGALAEEAVAGVHRVAAGVAGGGQQRVDVEVGGRADGLQRHRLAAAAGMRRVAVVGRVDRHGVEPQVQRGAVDAQRDLAAVGDQQFLQHRAAC